MLITSKQLSEFEKGQIVAKNDIVKKLYQHHSLFDVFLDHYELKIRRNYHRIISRLEPKKRLCATLSRSVGRGTNTAASYRSCIPLSGRTSAGRAGCGADLAECVSVAGFFLRPQGAFPSGYYPRRGGGNRPAPEAPLIRGMSTGP